MNYLDVSPMMTALRTTPEDFDMNGRWLRHNPSRHCFRFDPGHVTVRSGCTCSFLMIHPDQQLELERNFQAWQASYWRPIEINRQFAGHFRTRSRIRRALIRGVAALHRWLSQQQDRYYPSDLHSAAE